MKKAYIHIIPCALAIMALTGCGNDGSEPDISGKSICPEFSATIGSQSRAYDDKWNEGDSIGISGSGSSYVCYVTGEGDGKFSVKPECEPIYFHKDEESFWAYYPWDNQTDGTTVKINTSDQSKQKSFDFLWAKATGKKSNPNVTFNFDHKMVKLCITVNCGKGVSFDELKAASLSFSGFSSSGSFNIVDGDSSVDGPVEDWEFSEFAQFNDKDETTYFSLILLPQKFEVNGLELKATLNGDILQTGIDFTNANTREDGPDAKNEWVAGRQYNLSLTLNTEVEVTVNDASITDWNSIVHEEPIDAR